MALVAIFRHLFGVHNDFQRLIELDAAIDAARGPPPPPLYIDRSTSPIPPLYISASTMTEDEPNLPRRSRSPATSVTKVAKKKKKSHKSPPTYRHSRTLVRHIHRHYHHYDSLDSRSRRSRTMGLSSPLTRPVHLPTLTPEDPMFGTAEMDFHEFASDDDDFIMAFSTDADEIEIDIPVPPVPDLVATISDESAPGSLGPITPAAPTPGPAEE